MQDDYLPLAYLNAWEYCPRRFYLEYQLGEMADNEHIILGRHLHRVVDDEGQQYDGDILTRRHQWVWSDRLRVKGVIDLVEQQGDQLIPVEFKKGAMGRHLSDHFQLCAAGLCLEERTQQPITHGEIFYHSNRRRQHVPFTPELRQATEDAILAAHDSLNAPIPKPITNKRKCQACSLQGICLPFEVNLLRETT
ncbi:CRISPR-associated exonuclease Cas4/endonuclease Cas1 fusion [Halomicronema hongdechloris C2206]|uniref:CRISPR-associated exonuclease Cas4 n=1 Tax=Halomicronema hongdechloris C2206 TaxID=1641165 RepID=A0A1Z3HN30_9CYAN|nr:CRISPR-associated protein Cas4 [Halomicronema hongdechloris]ASC71718.1 CRISPR-associated exonuclease Cas4/endonuclease Cas1 fusion [Halomicronema hongdechloris C2206]